MARKKETQVRDGWKVMRWTKLVVLGACATSPLMAAQKAPSAADAQQFLASLLTNVGANVRFVDAAGRANYVTGKYTGEVKTIKGGIRKSKETIAALPERSIDKEVADVRVAQLDAIDAYGRKNACTTRITQVVAPDYNEQKSDTANDTRTFSFTITHTNEVFTYEPLTKFMSPAQVIDWSDVKIVRSPEHYLAVVSRGQSFPIIQLTYYPTDPDLADRIEYAMRFLAMSCGASAGS